jgi:hypothetical protein
MDKNRITPGTRAIHGNHFTGSRGATLPMMHIPCASMNQADGTLIINTPITDMSDLCIN